MKIFGRKLGAIALLAVTAIAAFAIGVVSFGAKPAVVQADVELPNNIVFKNIEDCIYDSTASVVNGGFEYAHALFEKDLSALANNDICIDNSEEGQERINTVFISPRDTFYIGVYTRAYQAGDEYNSAVCNFNQYDGNISIFTTGASKRQFHRSALGFYLNGAENSVVTFRMLYQAGYEYNFKDNCTTTGNHTYYYCAHIGTDGSVDFSNQAGTGGTTSYSAATLLTELQTRVPAATALYENNDELLISFGTYHTGVGTGDAHTYYYFKVVNETKGYTAYELLAEKDYYLSEQGRFVIEIFGIYSPKTNLKCVISGVKKPLFANYDYTAAENLPSSYVGELATTVPLNADYSHVAGNDQVLALGANNIAVDYDQGEYYGNSDPVRARATVNVVANTVVIKDAAGADINTYADQVKTFELPELYRAKTFIAYRAGDGKLYKQGESITLDGDKTVTLIESDAEFLEKVDLRLSENEVGGVRFWVKILTADYVALQSSGISIGFKIAGAEVDLVPASQSGEYSLAYIAKTDVAAAYFNTDVVAEIVIGYESGDATVLSTQANPCELASDLVTQNEIAILGGQALYNGTAALRLQKYLDAAND